MTGVPLPLSPISPPFVFPGKENSGSLAVSAEDVDENDAVNNKKFI